MRVLLCVTSLDVRSGGIALVNRNVLSALSRMRCDGQELDIRVLSLHDAPSGSSADHMPAWTGLRVESCASRRWLFCRRYLWSCLWRKPHLVFVDHLHLAVVPYLSNLLVRRPYVLFCHGAEFDGEMSRLRRASYRGAAMRLANSHFTAERLMTMFPGVSAEPCELGLDEMVSGGVVSGESSSVTAHDSPLTAHHSPLVPNAFGDPHPIGRRSVLIVGRLSSQERYKGHDQLIPLMPSLTKQFPDAQLVVVGEGDDEERLKDLARQTGVGRAILFTGFATGQLLSDLYARCRVFAMPSRGEGFGLVYLEAMRFAKPCIASRTDGGGEVVVDGVTGLHVDPGNSDEIRGALVRLLEDDQLAERMGQAGLDRLNEHYRFHHFCERLQSKLSSLCPSLHLDRQLQGEYLPPTTHYSPLTN